MLARFREDTSTFERARFSFLCVLRKVGDVQTNFRTVMYSEINRVVLGKFS